MSEREAAMAELYRRNAMRPEQKAAYEELMRRGMVKDPPQRSWGQRFLENVQDGWERSGAGQLQRSLDPQNDGVDPMADFFLTPQILEGGNTDRVLDATLGQDRGYLRSVNDQTRRDAPMIARERARRASYDARAAADPIGGVGDFAAFLAGQVVGAGVSPDSWVAPGKTVVGRAAGAAGVNAGADVLLQGNDVGSGVQDEYSPLQTAGAAVFGAVISGATDAVRPVSQMVRRAFTDPVAPRPDLVGTGTEGISVVGPDGIEVDVPAVPRADGTVDTPAAPVVPEFGIVQRVDRKSPIKDALARVREGEIPQMVGDFLGRAYTAVVSDQHPLYRATEDLRSGIEGITGAPEDLLPSQDPRKLARGRYDWAAIGHQDLLHGVHAYRGMEPTTPAMSDVLSAVSVRAKRAGEVPEVALQRFNEYMVARRASIEWDRFGRGEIEKPPVARTKEQADAFVQHIDTQDPEFRALSDSVNEFSGGLLKKALDGGLIDKVTYDASIAGRDFYVPLRRVMDDQVKTGKGGSASNKGETVKAFKGSERDVVDPTSVLIERTYRLSQRIRQNELNLSLIRLGERFDAVAKAVGDPDAANAWIRKVPRPVRKVEGARGDDTMDLFDTEAADEWRTGEVNDAGQAILYAWRNGQREAWEIVDQEWGKDVFEAMGGMSKDMQDTFLNTVAAGTTLLARTITRDPAFLFSNFIRDQLSTWIVTDVGFKPGEGAKGVIDEFTGADASRVYNLGGGLAGGANTAMLGEALHKADVLALAQKGIKAKYLSSLGGLLQLSEVTEVGTRLQIFKRGFDRARKAGLSEYDSLIEASFTARDVIDFGRHGSKMHYTRRLVTFLNAYVQGLDKTLRVLGTDGALTRVPLKDALRPLISGQPGGNMRAEDAAALKLAGKAWTKVAAIATFGAAIAAMFHDDPDYQQANEKTRATHWTIPFAGNLYRIPKPFELAFLSNIAERGIEATVGQDEEAWGKMWKGLAMLFAPPTGIPLADVFGGLKSNTNAQTGRPIVPEYLESMPPELQYQVWNSSLSKSLGDLLNISPAKIDYAIQGFGGPFGSYIMGASDAADPDRPSGSWTDLPVVRRFVSPAFRGSQDKREFYDRAGAKSSELRRALNGIKEYQERGRPEAAQAIFTELDDAGQAFVMSQQGEASTRRLHPLIRAEVFAREASRMMGELNGAEPKDGGAPLPPMNRTTRQTIEDAIERVTVAELRNAMVVTRQPGFQNKALEDRNELWGQLEAMAPEVAAELQRRLGVGQDKAYDYDALIELWPQVESRLRTEGSAAYLDDLASDAQGRTTSWGEKVEGEDAPAMLLRP
ncbi:hypothetical protein KOAAANKH_02528 [Brevundimonas sp. NIBR10]|uniref:LPD38 domain-containing protein n=1 Tax=Brevundimonas sp. NIBR10 TaxID=3015997 RepID=UPI0022F16665|nr:LPD38 domain-containing protein [Brevundimonas sp. NIBR10]WGM47646.1 hypothetical protein KOAAANKH_02528 [Brevundimonas sp. NIBR10]